jgi:hypothetical protein
MFKLVMEPACSEVLGSGSALSCAHADYTSGVLVWLRRVMTVLPAPESGS